MGGISQSVLPIVLAGLAGVLIGGAFSLRRQGRSNLAVGVPAVLGLLAAVGAALWLFSG